jgi:hypothetical protein
MHGGCLESVRSKKEGPLGRCYSYRQFCSLGPLPPRTPARPDPQVPKDYKLGPCSHGKIGSLYFYADGSRDDPAFGFCEIELSIQRVSKHRVRVELYCIADGYQSARGVSARHPLEIAVLAGEKVMGTANWHFPDVICGHADPMHFSADLDIHDGLLAGIDRVEIGGTPGEWEPCD